MCDVGIFEIKDDEYMEEIERYEFANKLYYAYFLIKSLKNE